jgi:hypothetical protein
VAGCYETLMIMIFIPYRGFFGNYVCRGAFQNPARRRRITAGDSNKLIARTRDLSPHTVKRHVANILDKQGLQTRGHAAAWLRSRR